MWKQSSGCWRGDQLSKRWWGSSVGWQRREAYTCPSVDQGGSMRPTDGYVTLYPHRKKNNQNKCLCSSAEAFDQQHIFGFRVGLLWTPEPTWNRICINTAGEECVNNATKEFCSRNVGWTWLTSGLCGLEFKRGGRIEWEAGEIFSVFNDNIRGKLVFLLFTDVSQYKCCDEMIFRLVRGVKDFWHSNVLVTIGIFCYNLWLNYMLIKWLSANKNHSCCGHMFLLHSCPFMIRIYLVGEHPSNYFRCYTQTSLERPPNFLLIVMTSCSPCWSIYWTLLKHLL